MVKINEIEYLISYCSKCRKKYDAGFVDAYFPYESENNKCMDCFKNEYYGLKAKLQKAREALEFVVKESGTSTNYNKLARETLKEIKDE